MADFKLLGGTDAPLQSLGKMTQGLGFPLRDVDPATTGGPVSILTELSLQGFSEVDQVPAGLGVATQLTFGAAQTTTDFDLDASGNVTCLTADEYNFRIRIAVGKTGGGLPPTIFTRGLLNGTPVGLPVATKVDNADITIPLTFEGVLTLAVNDVLTFEIIRDSGEGDSGGLYIQTSSDGWGIAPSTALTVIRSVAVQT